MSPTPSAPRPALVPRELIAREKLLMQKAFLVKSIRLRFVLLAICGLMGIADLVALRLPGDWRLLVGSALVLGALNAAADWWQKRREVPPLLPWLLQVVDTLIIGVLTASVGEQGYLGIPFFLVAAGAYGLGMPLAARVQVIAGCAIYPIARLTGLGVFDGGADFAVVILETSCLAALGWLSLRGPIRYTIRVRDARRALGALERGDFEARLPARGLDDLGFLAVSFNATAEALGNAVRALEGEVAERTRAEAALRLGTERLHSAERQATQLARQMQAIAESAAQVIAAGSLHGLRDALREASRRVIPFDDFTLALYDPAAETLLFLLETGEEAARPVAGGAYETVIRERKAQVAVTQHPDGRYERMLRAPIVAGDEVLGTLAVRLTADQGYTEIDVELIETLAALAASALRNIRLVEELRSSEEALTHQAHHDALTGLPNRRRFRERAALALANNEPECVAVLAVDLDGFKAVNDTLGHPAGDRLLVEVAARLLNATRGGDTVARIGGDEFAVLLQNVQDEQDAVIVAERIIGSFRTPFTLGGQAVYVGTSVGIALGTKRECPPAGESRSVVPRTVAVHDATTFDPIDAVIRDADLAMYQAKILGKGRWTRFDPSMGAKATERRTLESDLRMAIARDEMAVHFQPIFDLGTGTIVGAEALLRWTHRERGAIAPSEFIPIAEESGLIQELGQWVMREACRHGARWQRSCRERDTTGDPLLISVNVSSRQLQDALFVDEVRALIADSGLEPHSLVLEMTESTLIDQGDGMRERLVALREAGLLLAIDDFGTGYSALSYLQHFPVDVLKIDRAFVEGITRGGATVALARTIIALGGALGVRTVAEGIEEEPQRQCLEEMGCTLGQGFHLSRPIPPEAIDRLLASIPERVLQD